MIQTADHTDLESVLDYRFKEPRLLAAALDRTRLDRPSIAGRDGFERLEFLGDRVLGLVVAEALLREFPDEPEGHIARRFAPLVSRDHLAVCAQTLGLARHLKLGPGEADGNAQLGLLADAIEAVIGAVFHDGGLEAARALIAKLIDVRKAGAEPPRDAKTALQEWAQGRGLNLPVYRTLRSSGPPHAPRFIVEVAVNGLAPQSGEGGTKRAAEQAAAAKALLFIPDPPQ
jgi:ribonuclease III